MTTWAQHMERLINWIKIGTETELVQRAHAQHRGESNSRKRFPAADAWEEVDD